MSLCYQRDGRKDKKKEMRKVEIRDVGKDWKGKDVKVTEVKEVKEVEEIEDVEVVKGER